MSDYQSQISKSSNVNVRLQGQPGYYTLIKCANSVGYFALLFLTWRFFTHKFDRKLGTGCLIVSTGWLMITRVKLDHLLQSYFDLLSRIEMQLPVVLGTGLSTVAILAPNHYLLKLLAVAEIVCWIAIFVKYRLNKAKFIKQGHGPVPKGTWITPPESVLRPGDLILTSGNVATELHESVGHAEMYLRGPDGAGLAFSSYMVNGAIIQPFQDAARRTKRGHYIALHLAEPWSEQRTRPHMRPPWRWFRLISDGRQRKMRSFINLSTSCLCLKAAKPFWRRSFTPAATTGSELSWVAWLTIAGLASEPA